MQCRVVFSFKSIVYMAVAKSSSEGSTRALSCGLLAGEFIQCVDHSPLLALQCHSMFSGVLQFEIPC